MSTDITSRARDVLRRSNNLRPDRLDIKLPSLEEMMPSSQLPTPPQSGEMERKDSFSSEFSGEHGLHDHAAVPWYGPHDQSPQPLFSPSYAYEPRSPQAMARTMSRIASDFQYAIAQHSDNFRARFPTFHGPSIDDYETMAAFTQEFRARAADEFQRASHSPNSSPRQEMQHLRISQHHGRALAPRPVYAASPISQASPLPSPPIRRASRVATDQSPIKQRARLSSTVSFEEEEIEPRKKRRSTTGSSRRRSSAAISPKETKHNRNRSTKEKKSTDYRDYPASIAPPFDTMKNPMEAAEMCPEHNVANPRNLSSDPLKDELHESERVIAQKLNIDCAYFLCVKRQIFQRYLEHLKTRAFNWNKTAAQQCSNVDVGKTSQVFMFFNRVGWFNEELYQDKI